MECMGKPKENKPPAKRQAKVRTPIVVNVQQEGAVKQAVIGGLAAGAGVAVGNAFMEMLLGGE